MKIKIREEEIRAERDEYFEMIATIIHMKINIKPQKKL